MVKGYGRPTRHQHPSYSEPVSDRGEANARSKGIIGFLRRNWGGTLLKTHRRTVYAPRHWNFDSRPRPEETTRHLSKRWENNKWRREEKGSVEEDKVVGQGRDRNIGLLTVCIDKETMGAGGSKSSHAGIREAKDSSRKD